MRTFADHTRFIARTDLERQSPPLDTAVAVMRAPMPDGLICDTLISAPTVAASSGSAFDTARMAACSISATIAGVANTGKSPDPIEAAVFSAFTIVVLLADNPAANCSITYFPIRI